LRAAKPQPETGQTLEFQLPTGGRLLARLDSGSTPPGAGGGGPWHGCSDDGSQRRLGRALNRAGLASLRLNLRVWWRAWAKGTYAARCSSLISFRVLRECRRLALGLAPSGRALPLGAVGLSLGGPFFQCLAGWRWPEPPVLGGAGFASAAPTPAPLCRPDRTAAKPHLQTVAGAKAHPADPRRSVRADGGGTPWVTRPPTGPQRSGSLMT
jgi:hypothetical protein